MTRHHDTARTFKRRDRALRRLLEDQRERLLRSTRSRIREVRVEGGAEAGDVLDSAEMTEADIQTDLELSLLQMQRETLMRIESALAELDDGSYGDCVSCHGEIATERLQALPFAIRCTRCEAAHEAAAGAGPSGWRVPPTGLDAAA